MTKLSKQIEKEFLQKADKNKSVVLSSFFKTGKGQYGEGDLFLGITVPENRLMFKNYQKEITLDDIKVLLKNKYHDIRLFGVYGLVYLYTKGSVAKKKEIIDLYMSEAGFKKAINNWDLVDTSAYKIIGDYLYNHQTKKEKLDFIKKCLISEDLWIRRVIVVASFYDLQKGDGSMTLFVCKELLNDKHDLIHKATGWMLRELGKRVSELELVGFLNKYKTKMARTSYRYAIERIRHLV